MTQIPAGQSARYRFVLSLFSLLVGLGIVECMLRIVGYVPSYHDGTLYAATGDARGYGHSHNWSGMDSGVRVRTNNDGFRGSNIEARKKPGEFRVLVVGDSVAFGLGVEEDAIFPSQLDRILRLHHPQRAIRVMNSGVASYNTRSELESLKHFWHLEPDLIVLQYLVDNDSDLEPGIGVDPQTGRLAHPAASRFLPAPVSLALNRHSRTYNFLRYHFARIAGTAESPVETGNPNRFSFDDPGWIESRRALLMMSNLAREHNVPFIVGGLGLVQRLHGMETLSTYCAEHGIPYVELWKTTDVASYMKAYAVSSRDAHPNADGHRIIAERLAQRLDLLLSN